MKIADFLDKVYDQAIPYAADLGAEAFIRGSMGASSGYVIADIIGSDHLLMTKAFTIYKIIEMILNRSINYKYPNTDEIAKRVWQFLGGVTFTITLFNLGLISRIGAAVFVSYFALKSVFLPPVASDYII
jgi:hypothetical protein